MNLLSATTELIHKDFGLETPSSPFSDKDALVAWFADQIRTMIDERPGDLFSVLYIIDVDEEKIRFALSPQSPEEPAPAIARLVVERLFQKAETRLKYSGDAEGDW
jgi:hypothetical protein